LSQTTDPRIEELYTRFLAELLSSDPSVTVDTIMRNIVLSWHEESPEAVIALLRIWGRQNFVEPPLWQSPHTSYSPHTGTKTVTAEMRSVEAIIRDPDLGFLSFGTGNGFFDLLEDTYSVSADNKAIIDDLVDQRREEEIRRNQTLAGTMM